MTKMVSNNSYTVAITALSCIVATLFASTTVNAFSAQQNVKSGTRIKIKLMMSSSSSSSSSVVGSSRRDVLTTTGSASAAAALATGLGVIFDPQAAYAAPITAQSAANKAGESFQGIYSDPKHPDGYRVLFVDSKGKTTMTLSDGLPKDAPEDAKEKTFNNIPVSVNSDNNKELTFDFSFKGGPKNIIGTLADDKQSITFQDGNTWTKNPNKYDGLFKDSKFPDGYRIIRKSKGANFIAEINDTGNSKDSKFVKGRVGSLYAIPTVAMNFYFPDSGELGVEGKLCLLDRNTVWAYGTITLPDGSVWTRI